VHPSFSYHRLPTGCAYASGGFHLSRNAYICSKGNALACYSPQGPFAGAHIPSLSAGLDLPTLSSPSSPE